MHDIVIIGGGLAGLVNAIRLAQGGREVLVIEKNHYPFHRVCGEYISNEVRPYLRQLGLDIDALQPAEISKLQVTSPKGRSLELMLDLGGFGLSRYTLDHHLYKVALNQGVTFELGVQVSEVCFEKDAFHITLSDQRKLEARWVLGCYGKRAQLDRTLQRTFFAKRSPYLAVKYHIQTEHPADLIALHNFKDGYCGISKVEGDRYCLCYLTTRDQLRKHGTIQAMEKEVLMKNPHLHRLFTESEFLYPKPEVINEISFAPKAPVENHILMSGDAAGLITPLCGNGMAMAIHSAKILSELLLANGLATGERRQQLEKEYTHLWKKQFTQRLWVGRKVQGLFGNTFMTEMVVWGFNHVKPAANWLVHQTHGNPF